MEAPRLDVPLQPLLTLGTGGPARAYLDARDEKTLRSGLEWAARHRSETLILGGGSNLVIADAGFDGLVIHMGLRGIRARCTATEALVSACAGEDWDAFVAHCVAHDWAGIECLSGIPGRVGATPIQNVGAYGQEVKETILEVVCLDRHTGETRRFTNVECEFRYRDSRFKSREPDRYIVLEVTFRLIRGGTPRIGYGDLAARLAHLPSPSLVDVRHAVLAARREKSMVLDPTDPLSRSCGSFFVNPVLEATHFESLRRSLPSTQVPHYPEPDGRIKVPAAWLIEQAGFPRGHRDGNVGLSPKHALCITTRPGATSEQVRAFATSIKQAVRNRFAIDLHAEPRFVGLSPP